MASIFPAQIREVASPELATDCQALMLESTDLTSMTTANGRSSTYVNCMRRESREVAIDSARPGADPGISRKRTIELGTRKGQESNCVR